MIGRVVELLSAMPTMVSPSLMVTSAICALLGRPFCAAFGCAVWVRLKFCGVGVKVGSGIRMLEPGPGR